MTTAYEFKRLSDLVTEEFNSFSESLKPIYSICNKFVRDSVEPFMTAVEAYRLNYRSNKYYNEVYKKFNNFGQGVAELLDRLLSVYNVDQQNTVYTYKRHIFDLIEASTKLLATTLDLAHAASKEVEMQKFGSINDTCVGNNVPESSCSRTPKIRSNIYISQARYRVLKNRMRAKSCRLRPYAENGYLAALSEWCSKSVNNTSIVSFCAQTTVFMSTKQNVMLKQSSKTLMSEDIVSLFNSWKTFRPLLLSLVLKNYLLLSNTLLVSCLEKFLEEQHDLIMMMLSIYAKMQTLREEQLLDPMGSTGPSSTAP